MSPFTRRQILIALGAAGIGAGTALRASAQPVQEVTGPVTLDTGSDSYHARQIRLPANGGADHLVRVAWPRGAVPEGGFAVLCALDGHAVAADLDAATLARLADGPRPALILAGHDVETRFAAQDRTRDYTPPDASGAPVADPRGRPGGGAAGYLALLREQVLPRALALGPLNPSAMTLWGHSYGGLFALHAAFAGSSPFARHIAASPSLWWDDARFFNRLMAQLAAGNAPAVPLDLHLGEAERARASRPTDPRAQRLVQMRDALPQDALDDLDRALRAAGVPGHLRIFPGLSHGETFTRSLMVAAGLA